MRLAWPSPQFRGQIRMVVFFNVFVLKVLTWLGHAKKTISGHYKKHFKLQVDRL